MSINKYTKMLGCVALSVSMAFAMMGCSSKTGSVNVKLDPKNPVGLTVWTYYNGFQKVAFDKLVEEFNSTTGKELGIVVEGASQGSIGTLIDEIQNSANKKVGSQNMPNMVTAYPDTAYELEKMGLITALDPYFSKDDIDQYVPEFVESGRLTPDGPLYIFPISKSTEVFVYNKTDFDKFSAETGADIHEAETMEGLVTLAEKYYDYTDNMTPDVKDDGRAFFGRDALANYMIIGSRQLGHEILSLKDGKAVCTFDKTVMKKLWDCYYVPYINGYFASYGRFSSDDAKTGGIIALVGSSSGAGYFPDKVTINDDISYPIEAGLTKPPTFKDAQSVAVQQGAGICVVKSTPEEEYAASVFLKWFTDLDNAIAFSVGSGYMPVKKSAFAEGEMEKILDELSKIELDFDLNPVLCESLTKSVDIVNNSIMYSPAPFGGWGAARNIIEKAIKDKSIIDRETVVSDMAHGMTRQESVARLNTDANFNAWVSKMEADVLKTIGQ